MSKTITLALLASAIIFVACQATDQGGSPRPANASNAASAAATAPQPTPAAKGSPLASFTRTPDAHDHAATDGARRISVEEARAAAERGEAVFVDVRSVDAYRQGHIKGALSIPENEIAGRAGELPKGKLVVTYCA